MMINIETVRASLHAEYLTASAALKAFPRGPMGLTHDTVKASSEWKAAKRSSDAAFAALRQFNHTYKPVSVREDR